MKGLSRLLSYLVLAPAFLPLLYANGYIYPYVSLKTFSFRALGIGALASLLAAALMRTPLYIDRLKEKMTWIPAALLLVAYATSLIGNDFFRSFWSSFNRGDGLLTLSVAIILFYATLLIADHSFLRRLGKTAMWIGGLSALYLLLQWVEVATGMSFPLIEEPRGRFGGTFGNAAFFAAYVAMTFFLTLAAAREYTKNWRLLAHASAAAQLLAIFIAATRGTILALIIATLLAALYLAWRGEGRIRLYARGTLAALLILIALFFALRSTLSHIPIEPVKRMASISLTDGTVASRLFLWQNIGREALAAPIFGYGGEHIEIAFNRVYDPEKIVEQWFDRSHNAYLDYFVQYGSLGLLLYAAMIASALYGAWRRIEKGDEFGFYLALLVLTYAIQNFFVFDTALSLWLFLAVTAGVIVQNSSAPARALSVPLIPRPVTYGLAMAIIVLIIPVSIQPMRANWLLAQGYVYHVADVPKALEYFKRGLALDTYADLEYGYQAYSMYANQQYGMLEGEPRLLAYRFARDTLEKNYTRYPYDGRTAVYLAHILDLAPPEVEPDEARLNEVLDRALEISPRRLQPWFIRANISLKKGDHAMNRKEKEAFYRDGIAVLEEYASMQKESAEARFILAGIYLSLGEGEHAAQYAADADAVFDGTADAARRAMKYYLAVQDFPKLVKYMEVVAEEDSENLAITYDLAKAKYLTGDIAGARAIYDRLKTEAPQLVESDPAFVAAMEGKHEE